MARISFFAALFDKQQASQYRGQSFRFLVSQTLAAVKYYQVFGRNKLIGRSL